MKKKAIKVIYGLRIVLFIAHLLMLFAILGDIIRVGMIGYLFLIIDIVYTIKIISELLSKKVCYKSDFYYNIMQIGLFVYVSVLWSKLYFNNTFLSSGITTYLRNNYILLSLLMIFLGTYSILVVDKKNKDL